MPLIAATAKAGLDAKIASMTVLRVYTVDFGVQLVAFPIVFGTATTACPSVSTVESTPIPDTWDADGTAGSYRVTNTDGTVVGWQHSGANAVATTGSPHALLSTVTAVTGAAVSLNSFTMTEVCTLAGE